MGRDGRLTLSLLTPSTCLFHKSSCLAHGNILKLRGSNVGSVQSNPGGVRNWLNIQSILMNLSQTIQLLLDGISYVDHNL